MQFRHFANKVGNLERPFLKDFFPRWVESCGCPVLRLDSGLAVAFILDWLHLLISACFSFSYVEKDGVLL